jgi:hypothetical protein
MKRAIEIFGALVLASIFVWGFILHEKLMWICSLSVGIIWIYLEGKATDFVIKRGHHRARLLFRPVWVRRKMCFHVRMDI